MLENAAVNSASSETLQSTLKSLFIHTLPEINPRNRQIKNIRVVYNSKEGTNLHVAFSLDLQNISWLLNEQELEEFCNQQRWSG